MTIKDCLDCKFVERKKGVIHKLKTIAITHKSAPLDQIGKFVVDDSKVKDRLHELKAGMQLEELNYLATCNRVEFNFVTEKDLSGSYLRKFFAAFQPEWDEKEIHWAAQIADCYEGLEAVRHAFSVASSLDSLVVGEREIITQVRKAFDQSKEMGITGDLIRIVNKQTIETAKEIYTVTQIANKPVSVVSLAFRQLKSLNISLDARILIVGAGVTNVNFSKYLKKHGFKNFTVFNRTLEKAQTLANELKGTALPLSDLTNYTGGFDVLITCTGASEAIITKAVYEGLLNGEKNLKFVVDLAVPNDFDKSICKAYPVDLIEVGSLENIAKENLKEREKELEACRSILESRIEEFVHIVKERQVELAMRQVPEKIREIKENIFAEVYSKQINKMDDDSRKLLEEILNYMEKKCISVPMKMAREILIKEQ